MEEQPQIKPGRFCSVNAAAGFGMCSDDDSGAGEGEVTASVWCGVRGEYEHGKARRPSEHAAVGEILVSKWGCIDKHELRCSNVQVCVGRREKERGHGYRDSEVCRLVAGRPMSISLMN